MKHSIRVACTVCEGSGEVVDERGIWVVCGGCMGHGYLDENPPAPPEPVPQADGVTV